MRDRILHFEDCTAFEAWAIDENGIILEVIPEDNGPIALTEAQIEWPSPLMVGMKPAISLKGSSRIVQCSCAISKIEKVLVSKEGAAHA